jgi:hypothetical protein
MDFYLWGGTTVESLQKWSMQHKGLTHQNPKCHSRNHKTVNSSWCYNLLRHYDMCLYAGEHCIQHGKYNGFNNNTFESRWIFTQHLWYRKYCPSVWLNVCNSHFFTVRPQLYHNQSGMEFYMKYIYIYFTVFKDSKQICGLWVHHSIQ